MGICNKVSGCHCRPGFSGDNCEIKDNDLPICQNCNGICDIDKGCVTTNVEPECSDCGENGKCTNKGCVCDEGYFGTLCEYKVNFYLK